MAALTDFDVKSVHVVNCRGTRQKVSVYDLLLRSSSDVLTVPSAAHATAAAKSLTNGVTATSAAANEGETAITITGGAAGGGTRCIVAVAHLAGLVNNLGRDEDPT